MAREPTPERRKLTTGLNDRPRDAPIGQTGEGLPDDTSRPVEIDPEEEKRLAETIRSM